MNFASLTTLNGRLLADEFGALNEWLAVGAPDYSLFKKEVFISGTDTLPYRILFPESYDRTKSYPVVLFLHGAGERGTDNEVQLVHGASLFLKKENRRDFPCIAVFPQCPKETAWSSVKIDRTKTPLEFSFDYPASPATGTLKAALALVHQLIGKEAVDSTRIYISGLSMGGFGTFEAVWREPGLFAAAAPICGGGDAKNYSEAAAKVPFWVFHGEVDAVVPAEKSREMHQRLQELNASVKYSEYPGVNHNSWENAFAEKDYLPWLFSKKK
ncbi:MAG: prolyl oligopeptidase family serine peptidase [Bacteroidetes bacterium]|nr:prolyl oligopeptidase family serine peptidase [Bacteroidota bacterium]